MTFSEFELLACIRKDDIVQIYESMISKNTVYLITWSPDPKQLPDADFETQHRYCINSLAKYLSFCEVGLFCVEASQRGNPHYHGWYQTSADSMKELARIAMMKTFERFGLVKITDARAVKPGKYFKKGNGLYYYKKSMLDEMLLIEENPITLTSEDKTDWNQAYFFTKDIGDKNVMDKISDWKYYEEFYKDSTK